MFEVSRTMEFVEWLETLPPKHRSQVHERIQKIRFEGYFGTTKQLTKELWELRSCLRSFDLKGDLIFR